MADAASPLAALAERIDRLERQNRRLRQGAVALVLFGVAAAATAQTAAPRSTTVERLILSDDAGRVRAVLENAAPSAVPDSDNPVLTFFDRDGRAAVRLGLNDRGPVLEVMERDGRMRNYFGPPSPRPATER